MVSYGNSLRLARRSGWEGAYLDYDKLQKSLRKIDELFTTAVRRQETNKHRDDDEEEETPLLTTAVDSAGHASTPRMTQERLLTQLATLGKSFMMDLQAEIEKVSLFYLKKQGELADAVGALRFNQNLKNAAFSTTDALALISTYQGITFDATDEREVFSVLGVEVLHLLRFIGINSTAVRKILKKYRKLVLNVIKALNKTAQTDERLDEELQDSIINELQYSSALNSFDSSLPNAKTFRFSLDNHLQQLVNSGSINAIQASFLAALKESEEESQRHPAGITQPDSAKLRLKFVLVSIQTIRENAEIVNHSFQNFISRKAMIATGTSLGEIEGSTLDALHMLLRFEPDSILYMSDKDLRQWHQMVRGGSPLKTITKGQSRRHYRSMSGIPISIPETDEEDDVASEASKKQWGGVDSISLAINLSSVLLYTVNYYIVAPNANNYAVLLGHDGAYGATLIGASSFAALFAAFVYSVWYIKLSFKSALIFSSMCPLLGNIMYSLAVSYHSMTMALMGRILCGFGSAEVVNRQLISACVSFERMTRASAFFVAAGAAGMSIGPLLGSIFDLLAGRDHQVDVHLESTPAGGIVYDHVTAPGFFMALLWFFQLIVLVFFFEEPERVNGSDDSDFYDMDDLQRESSIVSTKSDDCAPYGSMIKNVSSHDLIALNSDRELRLSVNESSGKSSKSTLQMLLSEIRLTMRLVFGKPALPVRLLHKFVISLLLQ
jgi:MFS family permease